MTAADPQLPAAHLMVREMEMHVLRKSYASLTCAERWVLALVVSGLSDEQLVGGLAISRDAVHTHRRRVMEKMRAKSVAHLVVMATRLGPHRALNWANSADGPM